MNKKIDLLIQRLKDQLGLFLSIGFGIFLFVLFFQPFPFSNTDFNNRLLLVAGLATIFFAFMVLIRVLFQWLLVLKDPEQKESPFPSYFNGFILFILSSAAVIFYIRFVGLVGITFYITFKALIICLVPPVILGLYDTYNELKAYNNQLISEKKMIQEKIEMYEDDILNKSIEFVSENYSDNFSLLIGEVAFFKSADNYVEIVYNEAENFKKKLIRNTLKNIENQIRQYSNFIRCHRTCIVNVHFIEKLDRDSNNHWLVIKGFDEKLPVSRQFLLKIKEAI